MGLLLVAAALFAVSCAIERFHLVTGDASIYLVFAKSMWTDGLFHYGTDGPKHGASSPLWALLLSFARPFFGDNFEAYRANNLLIEKLQKKFDLKIAIVTGRGKESISYSLKTLLEKFDLKNSVFLEDESRELAKPNPQSLLDSIKGMNSVSTLFVGDSMEDFIMANKATDLGCKTIFCGIIGTSKNPQEKLELFQRNGAVLVLDSINQLPNVLNLE